MTPTDNAPIVPPPTEIPETISGASAGRETGGEVAVPNVAPVVLCKNCNAILVGRYCANCGQRADVHILSTRELVHEVLEGLTHSDSRLWRTLLSLWLRPGRLTEEFLAGRRAISLPPFRLYLIISVVFFLIVSVSQTSDVQVIQFSLSDKPAVKTPLSGVNCDSMTISNGTHPDWDRRFQRTCAEIQRDNARTLKQNFFAALPKTMFVFLPLIAFLNMLLYWRPRRRYAEQLVFFLHLQAFFFSAGILIVLLGDLAQHWPQVAGVSRILRPLLGWSLPVYTVLALRRLFRDGWPATLLKTFALSVAYFILGVLTESVAIVYAALELHV